MPHEPLQFGQYYHIYNRGNNRENLFVQKRNYPYFMQLYAKHILPVAETFAYCLLPNHFHFSIRTRTEEEQKSYLEQMEQIGSVFKTEPISGGAKTEPILKVKEPSRAFNNMFIAYARAFNKATNRTGVLFETPFRRKIISNDAYFYRLIAYIHTNPQKHGFVKDFRDWQWSSYDALLSEKETRLERETVLEWFGDRDFFQEFHQENIDEKQIADFIEKDFEDYF
jgi:putative transposase